MNKSEVITLCGSTRFKEKFLEIMGKLTLEGKIVIPAGIFGHSEGDRIASQKKQMLDELHLRKIDISDGIYVVDVNGYIGKSTRKEIEYTRSKSKFVKYYSEEFRGVK